jgi:acetamidase/formamidase
VKNDCSEDLTDNNPRSQDNGALVYRRMGKGMTVYLKVQVTDALFTFGDCHAAEGDAESSSSAIEVR